jgi:hypothetical protein
VRCITLFRIDVIITWFQIELNIIFTVIIIIITTTTITTSTTTTSFTD